MSKKMSFSYTLFMTCLMKAVFRTQGVSLKQQKKASNFQTILVYFFKT